MSAEMLLGAGEMPGRATRLPPDGTIAGPVVVLSRSFHCELIVASQRVASGIAKTESLGNISYRNAAAVTMTQQ
jgi:hypothetical protein